MEDLLLPSLPPGSLATDRKPEGGGDGSPWGDGMPFWLLVSSFPGPRCTAASQVLWGLQQLESLKTNPFFWGEKAVMGI